jgi:signal transduction histidine kinase
MRGVSLERMLPLITTALLLLVLGVALAITYREVTQSARIAVSERLNGLVRDLAASAEVSMSRRAQMLSAVGTDSVIRRALTGAPTTPADIEAAIRRALPQVDTTAVIKLWKADGTPVGPLQLEQAERAPSEADGGGVIPALGDSTRHGPLYAMRNRVFFWTVSPIGGPEHRIGWIGERRQLTSPPQARHQLQSLIGRDVAVYFRNDTGAFWATLAGSPAGAPVDVRVEHGVRSRFRADQPERGRVLSAEAQIKGAPWFIALERPVLSAIADARSTVMHLALSYAVLLIGAVVGAWAVSRWLTRPLAELTDAAAAIARGEYAGVDERLAVRGGEVGRLAESFNHMAAEVSASHSELEQQVEEAQALSEELEQANAELQETTLAAEAARDAAEVARSEAEAANRAKSQFLAMMSHELRTPLNAIAGYAELLQMEIRGPITAEQREDLERIRRSQRTLLSLIEDVLSFARIEAGRMEYHFAAVPLDEALSSTESLIAPQAQSKGITCTYERVGPEVRVWADRQKLERIVLNLLSNAVKFTDPGGRIVLSATVRAREVLVQVADTGCGIASDKLESIFEPFTQAEAGLTRSTEGTGLGLAISREFARAMQGDVMVESTAGRGSTFTLRLPLDPTAAAGAGALPAADVSSDSAPIKGA